MDLKTILAAIEPDDVRPDEVGPEISKRLHMLDIFNSIVLISRLHSSDSYDAYVNGEFNSKINTVYQAMIYHTNQWHGAPIEVALSLSDFDDTHPTRASVHVIVDGSSLPGQINKANLHAILRDFVHRYIQKQQIQIRRKFMQAKIGSGDLGTFCYRLSNEVGERWGHWSHISIFVLDKKSGDLRLRGQMPRRLERRHISDISVGPDSKSWVMRCYNEKKAITEYSETGTLPLGRTYSNPGGAAYSRIYWPIQIQFRTIDDTYRRIQDPAIGVIRITNPAHDRHKDHRHFNCFDAFCIEFISENLYSVIGSYVDKDVEGFDRDLAFHAAKSPATGCLRNIRLAARMLFSSDEVAFLDERPGAITRQFAIKEIGVFEKRELIRAFNNAYAFALDISSQVERANITEELQPQINSRVDRLFSDVIQKAINLAPYFEVSHSTSHHWDGPPRVHMNRLFDLELPPPVVGDAGSLTSVFKNIIENSIKYKRRDESAKIEFALQDDDDFICISIRDYGIGVPPEDIDRIFIRGVRSERAKHHSVKGHGLGLSYCRQVISACGGTIKAKSHEDGLEVQIRLRKIARKESKI